MQREKAEGKGRVENKEGAVHGPHYYQWQRKYLYSEKDRRVMLIFKKNYWLIYEIGYNS